MTSSLWSVSFGAADAAGAGIAAAGVVAGRAVGAAAGVLRAAVVVAEDVAAEEGSGDLLVRCSLSGVSHTVSRVVAW
eukprot:CAMPEP_0174909626 /NCGR_PEP_ID=MMETSP0167-20121228/69424_1 /TAXON_ID=38298 /ORGANISM="Rhodella maculata, Strain CCMP736" /LENGTH=76 /DNA_ID=CAMNT_0016153677 /DNA_START=40 /DNA_END=267 /DNA_ORIENTATION=+